MQPSGIRHKGGGKSPGCEPGREGKENKRLTGVSSCRSLRNHRQLGFPETESWRFLLLDRGGLEGFWGVRSGFEGGILIRFFRVMMYVARLAIICVA
eukprot:8403227-Pyramimonas_sp.AAC.1